MKGICLVFAICVAGLLAGCSAGNGTAIATTSPVSSAPGASSVSVTIAPNTIGVRHEGTLSFSASVNGSSNVNLIWSVKEGASGGTISDKGSYIAPSAPGIYHVVATSQADPSKNATATVTVTAFGFTSISGLNYARLQQTASLLPSGKVLIAGGGQGPDIIDGYWVVDQAELFDPETQSFSRAGTISRDSHTATMLPSGDVLIAGGEVGWDPTGNACGNPGPIDSTTAEIYQASSGQFVPTGSMLGAREGHQATLLNDGRVLITGGIYSLPSEPWWRPLSESEVFDPATGTFAAVGQMNLARYGHTATLLQNGKVLIAGGGYPYASNTAELFDPADGKFTSTGNMTVSRSGHTATLLPNGEVLLAGGGGLGSLAAELYDPNTGSFFPTGNMNIARGWHTATLLPDGTVLIAGGYVGHSGSTSTTEIYDPATGAFTLGPSLEQDRFSHTATLLSNGDVLIVGGASSGDGLFTTALTSAEIYH